MLNKIERSSLFEKEVKDFFVSEDLQIPDVFFYEETDSTNTRAKLYAENRDTDDRRPAIFFSHAQCAGRGTRGRTFESPAGGGVYISFLIYPDLEVRDALTLTTYAATAVCRAVKKASRDIDPKIKWVNDVTVGGKKLSGILTEGKIENGRLKYAIVGIGVNVKKAEHSPDVESIMTCLADHGADISADEFAKILIGQFFIGLSDAGSQKTLDEYRSLCSILGKEVNISNFDLTKTETAVDIDRDFALITRDKNGQLHRYFSADVSVRQKTD